MSELSQSVRNIIGVLDMAYAFGLMIEDQTSKGEDDGLLSMAAELKKVSMTALRQYPCHLFSVSDKKDAIAKAEKMVKKGFGKAEILGVTWTTFLLAELEKIVDIPKSSDGKPKKDGYMKNAEKRLAIKNIVDCLHGIHVHFDPEYDDDMAAIELGIAASRAFSF